MNDTIKFYSGEENGVVIESNLDDSIFSRQYKKAGRLFESLASHCNKNFPNIIAFCGDRGDGKTSAMMSFVESKPVKEHVVLTEILPSHFDEEHNILELILGQLYHQATNGKPGLYSDLMDRFAEVERCAALMKEGNEPLYDRIAEINELSACMDLNSLIERLFAKFLEYKDAVGKKIVIVIDDMDYNWFGAYTMIKMIEKYLRNQHCVVVVSVRIEQMSELVKVGFEREIKGNVPDIDLKKIAQKYINKVIPIFNRVEMPKVRDIIDKKLKIWECRECETNGALPNESFETVKDGVAKLIFWKTRYLFYNSKGSVSLIIPSDLRSLRQLVGLLVDMPDFKKDSADEQERGDNEENKRLFKYYFFYTWTQQMDEEDQQFVDKLVDNNDAFSINKMVVNYMQRFLDEDQKKQYANLLKKSNYGYNITVGDVFDLMDMIERNALELKSRLVAFFVKSFYSIRLYELYDEVTEDKKEAKALHPVSTTVNDEEVTEVYKSDSWFKNTNNLQRFVNGSYFTYPCRSILEYKAATGVNNNKTFPMDVFCIDAKAVNNFLKDTITQRDSEGITKMTDKTKQKCLMAEYLMLGILTAVDNDGEVDGKTLRKDYALPSYLSQFGDNERYYVFDIMAPFANMVNEKYTFDRFSSIVGDWYEFTSKQDWTILGLMKTEIKPDKDDYHPECVLVSDAIIRNGEVLSAVREKALGYHRIVEKLEDYLQDVAYFYEYLIDSEMRTYVQTRDQKGAYTIRFRFLEVLATILRKVNAQPDLNLLTVLIEKKEESEKSGSGDNLEKED